MAIVSITSAGPSEAVSLNSVQSNFKVTLVVIFQGGAAATVSVEYSVDGTNWADVADMSGLVAYGDGNLYFPVNYVRLNATSYTSGQVDLHVLQGA